MSRLTARPWDEVDNLGGFCEIIVTYDTESAGWHRNPPVVISMLTVNALDDSWVQQMELQWDEFLTLAGMFNVVRMQYKRSMEEDNEDGE